MFKIEKGVPPPPQRAPYVTWPEFEIGDSVVVPEQKARSAVSVLHKRGQRAAVKKQPDGTYRVWRVA